MKSPESFPLPSLTTVTIAGIGEQRGFVDLSVSADLHFKNPDTNNTNIPSLYPDASQKGNPHGHIDLGDMVDRANPLAIPLVESLFREEGLLDGSLYLLNNGNHDISMEGEDIYSGSLIKEHEMQHGKEYVVSGEHAVIALMTVPSYVGHEIEKELLTIEDQQERLDAYHQACNKIVLPPLQKALANRSQLPMLLLLHYPLFDPLTNSESVGNRKHLSLECIQAIDDTIKDGKGSVLAAIHAHHHGGRKYKQTDLYSYTPGGILVVNASGRARNKIALPFVTNIHIDFQNTGE